MILTKHHIQKLLGDQLVLWINPQKVDYHVGTKWPNVMDLTRKIRRIGRRVPFGRKPSAMINKIILRYEFFTISEKCYRERVAIENMEKYKKVEDFIENKYDIDNSIWYRGALKDLQVKGYASHKKTRLFSKEEIDDFFHNYVMDLVKSMESKGYDDSKSKDVGVALIGSDGAIHKTDSGTHRFYVARILGVAPVPVKIGGVHKEWFDRHVASSRQLDKLVMELKVIEENFS
jgi:hypothetical protein